MSCISLFLRGEVNGRMLDRVRDDLAREPNAIRLSMVIDSHGGSLNDAKEIYRAIRQHPAAIKRATIVGNCCSAAVVVLMACDYRRAQANSRILLHPTEIMPTGGGRWTASRYAAAAAKCQRLDDEVLDIMVERTGSPRAALAREDATESQTPLPKALGLGLIHAATGLPSRCSQSWPAAATAIMKAGGMIGMPSHHFSQAYWAACRAAPHGGAD